MFGFSHKHLAITLIALVSQTAQSQSDMVWYKPAAFPESFKINRDSCMQQNNNKDGYQSCMNRAGWTLVERSKLDAARKECRDSYPPMQNNPKNADAYFGCLRDKGWEEESKVSTEIRRLNIQSDEICVKPEYAEIIKNIPCRVREINLEHLSNSSRVVAENKQVYLQFFKEFEDNRALTNQTMRNGSMANKKMYEYRTTVSDAKVDDNRINLITGKITFGEYSKKRKELEGEFQQMVNKINEEVKEFINTPPPKRQ